MIPKRVALGITFLIRSNCALTGVWSDTPVTFTPGFLLSFTRPTPKGSETAESTTGTEFCELFAKACAAGVAMPTRKSFLSAMN